MKRLSVYFLLVAIVSSSFGFFGNAGDEKAQKKSACPYIQSLTSSECPFLDGKLESKSYDGQKDEKSASECPYLNKKMEGKTGCPFIDGQLNQKSNNKVIKDNWKEIKS